MPSILAEQLCDPKVVERITCPVCTEILNVPKCHGPCGHYLCDGCWTRCLHSGNEVCPICRSRIVPDSIQWNSGMEMYIASLRIRCCFAHKGCCWEGELEMYAAHARECPVKKLQELEVERDKQKLLASRVGSLRATVDARIAENVQLKGKLEQSRREVENLSSQLNSTMEAMGSKLAKINALEASLEDKETLIKAYREQLASRGKQIAAKDKALGEQLCALRAKDDKVGQLCETLRRMRDAVASQRAEAEGGKRRRLGESLRTSGNEGSTALPAE